MPRQKPPEKTVSVGEAFGLLAAKLKTQAINPNVLAYKPHAKQVKFHASEKKVKLYIGGNRSGKTHGGVVEDIWRLQGRHPYRAVPEAPTRGRIVCVDFNQGINGIIIPKLKQLIPPSLLIGGSWEKSYHTQEKVLTCANGSTLELMTFEQKIEAFAGTSRHWCVDEKTECLTKRGWLSYEQVTTDDLVLSYNMGTKLTEWVPVLEVYTAPVAEYLNRYTSRGAIDALVTDDHRWIVSNKKTKKVHVKRNHSLTKSEQFIISAEHSNENKKIWADDVVKLVGWIATDGTYNKSGMSICQSESWNLEKCKEIEKLYNGSKTVNGTAYAYSIVGSLRLMLLSIFSDGYKVIPMSFINELTKKQQQILLDTVIKGDGMQLTTGGFMVSQKIKERRDSIMALGTLCGFTTTAYKNQTTYNIQFKRKDGRYDYSKSSVDSYDTTKEYYEGIVWCPNNINGSWVARRNNRIYITGNCHYDEEPPKAVYNECQARLIDTDGDAFLTMTPLLGMTWVYDEIYLPGLEERDEDIEVIIVSMDENPYLKPEARERYLKTLDPEERKSREKGQFVSMGGLIYKTFNTDTHVIPYTPEVLAEVRKYQIYTGMDHGYNAPTAWIWVGVAADGTIIVFDEHYKSEMLVSEHSEHVKKLESDLKINVFLRVADPALAQRQGVTGTSIQTEYAINGINLALGNNDVKTGIIKVQQYLGINPNTNKPYLLITENCVNLIKEMKRYRWKTYTSKKIIDANNPQEEAHKKDDHLCDALRYLVGFMPDLAPARENEDKVVAREAGARYDELLASMASPLGSNRNTQWTEQTGTMTSWESD